MNEVRYKIEAQLNPADICTAQQKGARYIGGHIMFYTKPEVEKSNAMIRAALIEGLRPLVPKFRLRQDKIGRGDKVRYRIVPVMPTTIPKGVPVAVEITYSFPFQSNATKARKQKGREFMTERPDLDNLTKSVLDELTDIEVWKDDGQVVQLSMRKIRTHEPKISIDIETLPPLDELLC